MKRRPDCRVWRMRSKNDVPEGQPPAFHAPRSPKYSCLLLHRRRGGWYLKLGSEEDLPTTTEVPVPSGTGTSGKSRSLAANVDTSHLRVQLSGTASSRWPLSSLLTYRNRFRHGPGRGGYRTRRALVDGAAPCGSGGGAVREGCNGRSTGTAGATGAAGTFLAARSAAALSAAAFSAATLPAVAFLAAASAAALSAMTLSAAALSAITLSPAALSAAALRATTLLDSASESQTRRWSLPMVQTKRSSCIFDSRWP